MAPTHARRFATLLLVLAFAPSLSSAAGPPGAGEVERLHRRIDGLLRSELNQTWYPRALDDSLGGFHQNFARDWSSRPDDNRFLVYQARMTWTAAAFARYSQPDRVRYEAYARRGIEYIDRVMRDKEQGGFHWILGPKGEIDPRLGSEKHVYGTAFALYAASVVYDVTRDDLALKVARDAFDWLETKAHDPEHGGYFEAITREGKPILVVDDSAPIGKRTDRLGVYYGFKSMNSHIHLLEALAEFYRIEKTPPAKSRLEEVHAIVRDRIAIDPGALNLYLTRDWRAVPAHDSFGHDIETAYLLVESAEVQGLHDDKPTWRMARKLVDHALDWGWDDEHGGFYDKGDAFAAKAYDTTKVWWTQAEGLNALLLMHRKYGTETDRYWNAFIKQWAFIESHQLDPEHGGWYGETTREGKRLGDGAKATQWKANYHTSRAMMNVATTLATMHNEATQAGKGK
jgi:mannobiose 2-epimerase